VLINCDALEVCQHWARWVQGASGESAVFQLLGDQGWGLVD
jgi:hypothetical protein